MALPASGSISMNQVNVELGCGATSQRSLNDAPVRTLFGKSSGQISMSDGWGKSNLALGQYSSTYGGYYTGTQSGYYLFVTTTTVGRQWKTSTTSTDANSTTDGYTNTMNNANATHPAFQYADGLSAGGFSDWYVGSICELVQQYYNRSCGTIPSYGTGTYWSSTNFFAVGACWVNFSTGQPSASYKTSTCCVRPIRRAVV